jgi:CRP-like cAMP-binding protein
MFAALSEGTLAAIAQQLVPRKVPLGFTFFRAGQPADRMYIVSEGSVALIDPHDASGHSTRITAGEAFGADAFLTNGSHTMTAVAVEDSEVYALRRKDFEPLLERDAELRQALAGFFRDEHTRKYLTGRQHIARDQAARWIDRAVKGVEREALYPSLAELKQDAASHANVAMAIFLGLLLDGIPESLIIGASILHDSAIGFSLIGGVFVSNFPEALSSAAGMREQGMAVTKVIGMWTGMVVIAGCSSLIGAVALGEASPPAFSFIEGIAGGAMLTVVAETLLPEAFHKGGGLVGISTLMGFLAASLLGEVSLG